MAQNIRDKWTSTNMRNQQQSYRKNKPYVDPQTPPIPNHLGTGKSKNKKETDAQYMKDLPAYNDKTNKTQNRK